MGSTRSRSASLTEKTPILVNDENKTDSGNSVPPAAATMGSFVPLRSAMKDPASGSSNKSVSWSDKSGDSLYVIKAVPKEPSTRWNSLDKLSQAGTNRQVKSACCAACMCLVIVALVV